MENSKIRVTVRKRPLTSKETKRNDYDTVDCLSADTLCVKETKVKVDLTKFIEQHTFTFDQVYAEATTNEEIYQDAVQPLVQAAFDKTKVTCFAYGQTGSGKTFTMMGTPELPGLYLHAVTDMFRIIH
jgi:kinesin family protein 2/24